MSLIEWNEAFRVGVASVDLEHRALIELINRLHDMLGDRQDIDSVVSMLGEIYAQIAAHFALEEKYMRDSGYPHYAAHKDDHEHLLDELRDIMDRVEDAGSYDEAKLAGELQAWFTEHFQTHDARLHRHAS